MSVDNQSRITIKPVINYPGEAQVGKSYLMTIDLQVLTSYDSWPYEAEEYPVWCILKTLPLFSYKPLGDGDSAVVLHRFGGTYGPAMFMLTAAQQEMSGEIEITLVNQWGVAIDQVTLTCTVTSATLPNLMSGRRMAAGESRTIDNAQEQPSAGAVMEEAASHLNEVEESIVEVEEKAKYDTSESETSEEIESSTRVDSYSSPLDSFTDREEILAQFEQSLRSIQSGQFRLLAVKGNSGTGKTFLISYLTQRIFPTLNWQAGQLSFAQSTPDFRTILAGLEDALKGCVPRESLKRYREKRDEYNRRFDEYRATITISLSAEASEQSSISNVSHSVQVNAQLRERELQLRFELTRALVELAEESTHPLCLFIDGYERLLESDPELDGWLWEKVLLDLVRASPQPLLVVTCGWERPNNAAIKPFLHPIELDDFNLAQMRSYLEKQGIITATAAASQESDDLESAFYELTHGNALVLALTVDYFKQLSPDEQTAQSLRMSKPLVDEQARVEFLQERLLARLAEPYRTLLERGPILRSFDRKTLQTLLSARTEIETPIPRLDERTYRRFVQYPFISPVSRQSNDRSNEQCRFHSLIRRLQLEDLRYRRPEMKEQLNRLMADFYRPNIKDISRHDPRWLAELSESEFAALVEWFYHALQLRESQAATFEEWDRATGLAIEGGRHQQAEPLLEVVRQLAEDGEPYLNGNSVSYGRYLIRYSEFIATNAVNWQEALIRLEQAVTIFQQTGNFKLLADCYNNMGYIYRRLGELEQALNYFEQALNYREQTGDPVDIAISYNNIGSIYKIQGKLEQALAYYERALTLLGEQVADSAQTGLSLSNIGSIYQQQRNYEQALKYYEQALQIYREMRDRGGESATLSNLGAVYSATDQWQQAIACYQQALEIYREMGGRGGEGRTLNNLGRIYNILGQMQEALKYYEQALQVWREIGDRREEGRTLNNPGLVYRALKQNQEALYYFKQALQVCREVGDREGEGITLQNIGTIYFELGRYDIALACFLLTRAIFEEGQSSYRDSGQNWIDSLRSQVGERQFYELLASVEPRASEIVKQVLSEGSEQEGMQS